jgi:hypothetical protein
MPEVIAYLDPGADITAEASVALTGGRCVGAPTAVNPGGSAGVSDSGDGNVVVGLPTAGGWCLGVASHDAAIGKKVNVMRGPKVVPVECSAAVAVGAEVMAGTDGRVATRTAGNTSIGIHIGAATTTAGQYCKVLLFTDSKLNLT